MSRKKKCRINENSLGGRLRTFREARGINLVEFSILLGISHGNLSDIENNKSKPTSKPIEKLIRKTDINIYWLFTGEGEPAIRQIQKKSIPLDENPKISELMVMTQAVLKSGTKYSFSLGANIRSFHHSVELEQRLAKMEIELNKIKKRLDQDRRKGERRQQDLELPHNTENDRRSGEERREYYDAPQV